MEDWTDRLTHADLPPEAERALRLAGASWERPEEAHAHLAAAAAAAPGHRAVHVGTYRFHFYQNDLESALPHALACVEDAARRLNIATDWRTVRAGDAAFDGLEPEPRFFLFALKAMGYVLFRAGRTDEGLEALRKVMELDAADATATRGLVAVIERGPEDADD